MSGDGFCGIPARRSGWRLRSSRSACSRAASASARCRRHACRSSASRAATARARPSRCSATSTATASRLRRRHALRGCERRRLRHRLRLPRPRGRARADPTALNLATASFRITGHGGELLGFSRHRRRLQRRRPAPTSRIGAPMATGPSRGGAAPSTSSSARARRATSSTTELYLHRATRTTRRTPRRTRRSAAATRASSPTRTPACRVAAMPDVNGDRLRRARRSACRTPTCTGPGGGGAAVLYGKPHGRAHQPRRPLGGRLPVLLPRRLPDARQPARRRDRRERPRHDRRRLARPRGRRAAGRPERHASTPARSGSSAAACRRSTPAAGD